MYLTHWKVGRVIDRAGLEIRYTPFGYRGFESLTFRAGLEIRYTPFGYRGFESLTFRSELHSARHDGGHLLYTDAEA